MAKKQKESIYVQVTNKIVDAIESGKANGDNWHKPWAKLSAGGFPQNILTHKPYRGVNTLLLWVAAEEFGYDIPLWGTFKQIAELGGSVKKGEKSTGVTFYGSKDKKENGKVVRGKDGKPEQVFFHRFYNVFNISQTDLDVKDFRKDVDEADAIAAVEKFVDDIDHVVRHGGDRAYYDRAGDFVGIPLRKSFESDSAYFGTRSHELGHWTGAEKRLKREFGKRFGDDAYAFEELVAELTSAFICTEFGVAASLQHEEYVADWLRALKNDSRAVFTAASKAQEAVDFLKKEAGVKLAQAS